MITDNPTVYSDAFTIDINSHRPSLLNHLDEAGEAIAEALNFASDDDAYEGVLAAWGAHPDSLANVLSVKIAIYESGLIRIRTAEYPTGFQATVSHFDLKRGRPITLNSYHRL